MRREKHNEEMEREEEDVGGSERKINDRKKQLI
jgi:hypothetical protein